MASRASIKYDLEIPTVADQIIFTSAVRGIKPGASGYCTVLRSPGIRTALEQALEKISVFEHSKCNSGRMTYSYRQIDVRDTTYCVLSRIGDADKDYTGRTNFLAHHLVFQKKELPDLSPADILLNWSGWCQQWVGEPREESVKLQSLQELSKIYPPAKTWKEHAIGVDGAIKFASDMQNSFALRSKDCTDSSLLLLIAEAMAVRAKFKKSYQYTWTTTFSVGLAATGSTKAFKWLMLRATDDYDLPNVRTAIDLDAALLSDHTTGEEIVAIALEGQYSPQQKPIPLNSEKSAVTLPSSRSGQALPSRGEWGRPNGNYKSHPIKSGPGNLGRHGASSDASGNTKRSNYLRALVFTVSLLILAGGIWIYKFYEPMLPAVPNYEKQYGELIKLHEQLDDSSKSTDYREKVEDKFRAMFVAIYPKNVSEDHDVRQDLDTILDQMQKVEWDKITTKKEQSVKDDHDRKFFELRKFLLDGSRDLESSEAPSVDEGYASVPGLGNKSGESAVESAVETAEVDTETIEEDHAVEAKGPDFRNTDPVKPVAKDLSPLVLNDYGSVEVRQIGREIPKSGWKPYKEDGVSFRVTDGLEYLEALNKGAFSQIYEAGGNPWSLVHESKDKARDITLSNIDSPVAIKIIHEGKKPEQKPELWVFTDKGSDKTLKLGEFNFNDKKSVSAKDAFNRFNGRFDNSTFDLWIVAKDDYATTLISRSINSHQPSADKFVGSLMVKLLGDTEVTPETIIRFNDWVSSKMASRLKNKRDEIKKGDNTNLLPQEAGAERSALLSAYEKIIKATEKNKTIRVYYESYRNTLEDLERKRDNEKNGDKEAGIRDAYGKLINYFADSFKSEKVDGIRFICSWDKEARELEFEFKGIFNKKMKERELEDLLKRIVQGNERKSGQIEEDPYAVPRVWKRIEFRRPGGAGTVASIEIKYSI